MYRIKELPYRYLHNKEIHHTASDGLFIDLHNTAIEYCTVDIHSDSRIKIESSDLRISSDDHCRSMCTNCSELMNMTCPRSAHI